jgi:hypothetical protein
MIAMASTSGKSSNVSRRCPILAGTPKAYYGEINLYFTYCSEMCYIALITRMWLGVPFCPCHKL